MTAPSGKAQQNVIRSALREARISHEDVAVVECHGTGTALGDPIEVGALTSVFRQSPPAPPLMVGTLKTNSAHSEVASGLLGLIKSLQQLLHAGGPANLHLRQLNKYIDIPAGSGMLMPNDMCSFLQQTRPNSFGTVGAFGLGGCNAQAVVARATSSGSPVSKARSGTAGKAPLALKTNVWMPTPINRQSTASSFGLRPGFLFLREGTTDRVCVTQTQHSTHL